MLRRGKRPTPNVQLRGGETNIDFAANVGRGSELPIDTPNASKTLSFRNQSIEDSSNLPDPEIIAADLKK